MRSGAELSIDRIYRYDLWRIWDESKLCVAFIGLNPSTADEKKDDPTIRRCMGYAKSWGYGGFYMLNLFAYRATDPKEMKLADNPVGPENDMYITSVASVCDKVIAAWGLHGTYLNRSTKIKKLLPDLMYLKKNKNGEPSHPLYLKKDLGPKRLMRICAKPRQEAP